MSKDELQDLDAALEACLTLIDEQGFSLDRCLERFPQYQEDLGRLLPVALNLRGGRSLTASDALRSRLAVQLEGMAHADNQNSPGFLVTNLAALRSIFRNWNPVPQRRAWMIPALVTFLIVVVVSMGGLVAGADAAGPGDLLFGLDTAIEDVRLSFTNDDEKEVELLIEFATERLEELKIEIEGEGDQQDIEAAFLEFEEALATIEALLGGLTPEQRAAFEEALALLIALKPDLTEFEFEFEIEDGKGVLELELETSDGPDDDDLDDDDLDDDDLDDDDLDDDDPDDDDPDDDDLDDDDLGDHEQCDSDENSDRGSSDEDDGDDDDDDDNEDDEDECEDDDDEEDEDEEDDDED
jgi:hypothetical protein